MGSLWVSLSFRVDPDTNSYVVYWCFLWCLLSAFRILCGCHVHQWELLHWDLHYCNPLEYTLDRHMCLLVIVHCLLPGVHLVAAPSTALSREASCYSFTCLPTTPSIWWGLSELCILGRVTQSLQLPCMVGRGPLFQVVFHPVTHSTLNLWWALNPGDSGVVIGYEVDELSHKLVSGALHCLITH